MAVALTKQNLRKYVTLSDQRERRVSNTLFTRDEVGDSSLRFASFRMTCVSLAKIRNHIIILLIVLFAFFMGVYNLGDTRISSDGLKTLIGLEGETPFTILIHYHPNHHVFFSFLLTIIHTLSDKFYLMRWAPVVFGVLAVPLTYRLGQAMGWRLPALMAAFLIVITPIYIRYLRQLRGYSATLFFGLIVLYCLWQAINTNQKRYWLGFVAAMALGIYTHFYVALAGVTATIIVGGEWLLNRKDQKLPTQVLKSYIISLIALGAALLLLLGPIATQILNVREVHPQFSPPEFGPFSLTWDFFRGFVGAFRAFSPLGGFEEIPDIFLVLVILGGFNGLREASRRRVTTWLILWWLMPFCINLIIIAIFPWSTAQTRYYLYTTPAYVMLGAYGILTLAQLLLTLLKTITPSGAKTIVARQATLYLITLILLLGIAIPPTLRLLQDFSKLKTDQAWTAVIDYLRSEVNGQDIIVCEAFELPGDDGGKCRWQLNELAKSVNPNFSIRSLAGFSKFRHMENSRDNLQCQGRVKTDRSCTVWLVMYFRESPPYQVDMFEIPPGFTAKQIGNTWIIGVNSADTLLGNLTDTGQWLTQQLPDPKHQLRFHVDLSQLYALAGEMDTANAYLEQALNIYPQVNDPNWIPELREVSAIVKFYAPAEPSPQHLLDVNFDNYLKLSGYALEPNTISPPAEVRASFYWDVLASLPADYTVFVHLLDSQNNVVGYFDFQPFDAIYPTSQWAAGTTIREARIFSIPPNLAPGDYTFIMGLYQPETMHRLGITNDTTGQGIVELGTITVREP